MASRGSIHSYSKDVKNRQKKVSQERRENPSLRGSARATGGVGAGKVVGGKGGVVVAAGFSNKPCTRWDIGDVLSWLSSLSLSQYGQKFAENEISGEILLDVGLDDLDYMGIKVLGHRKVLLKGIEELKRKGGRASGDHPPPPPADDSQSLHGGVGAEAKSKQPQQKQHWSTVTPLSENTVTSSGGGLLGEGDYDEASESAAFKNAVMEWRKGATGGGVGGGGGAGDNDIDGEKTIPVTKGVIEEGRQVINDGGNWENPWGGLVGGGSDYNILLGGQDVSEEPVSEEPETGGGGALLHGTYDEQAEAKAFKEAVAEFRNPSLKSKSGGGVGGGGGGGGKGGRGGASNSSGANTDALVSDGNVVAANLARRMEDDFERRKEDMARRRKEAEEAFKERLARTHPEDNKENVGIEGFDQEEFDRHAAEGKFDDDDDNDDPCDDYDHVDYKQEFKSFSSTTYCEGEKKSEEKSSEVDIFSPRKTIGVEVMSTTVWSPEAKDVDDNEGVIVEVEDDSD